MADAAAAVADAAPVIATMDAYLEQVVGVTIAAMRQMLIQHGYSTFEGLLLMSDKQVRKKWANVCVTFPNACDSKFHSHSVVSHSNLDCNTHNIDLHKTRD